MHEYSIAIGIIDTLKDVLKEEFLCLNKIELTVGSLSGVYFEALHSALELILESEGLDNVTINISEEKGLFICSECQKATEIEPPLFICKECGSSRGKISGGKKIIIKAVEVNDGKI
ncbi:MAG: hypothetical protein DRH51_01340 [Candidatus Coatesbacteria bacterium]|nr:MAG: hypothetical protein DRH51_01340 [Candidatus Coatesbacteria bacterium]RLC43334.1 MAG: hypothetical protein DRH49_01520 [Candidatus Coatesbacteria bacterium]RLC44539.1 MAG: hypothetical protein DRH44_02105 [Candidatus Coatesbacteria bacterium]HEC80542.1 hydrogenase maturation nickel metallochaperone HypA [Bacillota bacterium]